MAPEARCYNRSEPERLEQALAYLQSQKRSGIHANVSSAARDWYLDRQKLRRRFLGITTGERRPPPHKKLSDTQEASLIEIVKRSDLAGLPILASALPALANNILKKAHGKKRGPAPKVGICWSRRFKSRHTEVFETQGETT